MEPEGSLQRSQQPATGPYPQARRIQSTPSYPVSIKSVINVNMI